MSSHLHIMFFGFFLSVLETCFCLTVKQNMFISHLCDYVWNYVSTVVYKVPVMRNKVVIIGNYHNCEIYKLKCEV